MLYYYFNIRRNIPDISHYFCTQVYIWGPGKQPKIIDIFTKANTALQVIIHIVK